MLKMFGFPFYISYIVPTEATQKRMKEVGDPTTFCHREIINTNIFRVQARAHARKITDILRTKIARPSDQKN